jgi:hypothetical protein
MRNDLWLRCPNCDEFVVAPGENQISTPLFVATCPHCGLEFDWRLSNKDFLRGAMLHWEEYWAPSEIWDHDHCAMCWQTFMEEDYPDVEHAGYVTYTPEEKWWICQRCFEELGEEMDWQLKSLED